MCQRARRTLVKVKGHVSSSCRALQIGEFDIYDEQSGITGGGELIPHKEYKDITLTNDILVYIVKRQLLTQIGLPQVVDESYENSLEATYMPVIIYTENKFFVALVQDDFRKKFVKDVFAKSEQKKKGRRNSKRLQSTFAINDYACESSRSEFVKELL